MGWEDGTVPPLSLPFLLLFAVLCHCIRKFSISPRRYVRLFNREIHYDNRPLTHIRRCVPVNVNQRIMNFGQKMLISVRQKITPRTPEDAVECAVLIPEFTWICRPHPPSISKRVVTSGRANDIMTGDARARLISLANFLRTNERTNERTNGLVSLLAQNGRGRAGDFL